MTAEVQPTFSKMADTSQPRNPFLIRTSLRAQNPSVKDLGLLETFCVSEGSLSVEYPGSQQGMWQQKTVEAGKCLGFLNGQLRALGPKNDLADWRAVCLVGTHCEIPESAKKLIAKKQMRQALALEEALVGSDAEEGEVDDEVILATTAANFQSLDPGSFIPEGPQSPCIIDPNRCESGFPPNPNVGGSAPPPTPFFNNTGGGGNPPPSPPSPLPSNIQTAASLWPPNGMPGGQGLLSFIESDFMADIELVGVDSGNLSEAPHQGKAPEGFFVVKDLSPAGAGPPSSQTPAAAGLPSNQDVPMDFVSFHEPPAEWYGPVAHRNHNPKVQLGVGELAQPDVRNSPSKQAELLAQFARSASIDPDDIFGSVAETAAESGCQLSSLSCFEIILESGQGALGPNPEVDADAGIDASIQARSSSNPGDLRLVSLKKGVVLGNTQVSLALQEKTNASFSGLEPTLGQAIEGAAVAILGKTWRSCDCKCRGSNLSNFRG